MCLGMNENIPTILKFVKIAHLENFHFVFIYIFNTVEYQKFTQLGTRDCVDFRILQISGHITNFCIYN